MNNDFKNITFKPRISEKTKKYAKKYIKNK